MNNTKNKMNNPKNKKNNTKKGMTWFTIVLSGSNPQDPLEVLRSKVTKFINNY